MSSSAYSSTFASLSAFLDSNPSLSEIAEVATLLEDRSEYWLSKDRERSRDQASAAYRIYCSEMGLAMARAAKRLREMILDSERVLFAPDPAIDRNAVISGVQF